MTDRLRTGTARSRPAALVVAGLVGLVVLWPALAHPGTDGFPLSTYPMFSARRPAVSSFATVVGVDDAGRRLWLSPSLVNGTREVVQASVVVTRRVADGQAAALCAEVAARVARAGPATARIVEVVTLRYDAVAYFSADGDAVGGSDDARTAPDGPASPAGAGPAGPGPAGPRPVGSGAAAPLGASVHARCPVPR